MKVWVVVGVHAGCVDDVAVCKYEARADSIKEQWLERLYSYNEDDVQVFEEIVDCCGSWPDPSAYKCSVSFEPGDIELLDEHSRLEYQEMVQGRGLTALDSLRASLMATLLDETGRQEIWKYDVVECAVALAEAVQDQNFDNMEADNVDKQFALIGPGIVDSPFDTKEELTELCWWLCLGGYLSCYANPELKALYEAKNKVKSIRKELRKAYLEL
jgi:hypothetical protein